MSIASFSSKSILKEMYKQRLISATEARRIDVNLKRPGSELLHPIAAIARSLPTHADLEVKLNLEQLCEWFAQQCDIPYYHIDPLNIEIATVTAVVAPEYAKQNGLLAVEADQDSVTLAVKNPLDLSWKENLSGLLRKDINIVFANPNDIDRYMNEFYSLAKSISKSRISDQRTGDSLQQNLEQLIDLGRRGQLDAEDHHIVQVVDWLLQYAFEQRASDIHLEPRKDRGEIRFRIDGVLHYAYQVPPNVLMAIIGRIKTLGRMDIAEKRRPLDGRLKTRTPDDKEIELRLSTVPTAMGEKMVMRIFDPEVLQRSFTELGLNHRDLDTWNRLTTHTHGIVLVTGPTGSGKTTTLYSTLRNLADSEVNVCTIEDPIEMVEPSFNQIQVHASIDLTFSSGVRALLRQDPDIIMIGEIRDLATAEMAIQAALTGHLVLSTLHTNDAPSAVTRLMELGVPAYLINATMLGVMAQRLVRTLCPECKQPATIAAERWEEFTQNNEIELITPAKPVGCLECRQTGYRGRIGLYEMLEITDQLKQKIIPGSDLQALRRQAREDGLQSLRISGAKKVADGITTIEEVLRVTPSSSY
ncbi:MAG: general secretion pathway protein E [Arenicella sp.]|jgi:general secretion pathway protein E